MFTRRHSLGLMAALPFLPNAARAADAVMADLPPSAFSEFSRHLQPIGRVLEIPDTYVWCNAPIEDEKSRVHLFFSHWEKRRGMGGWINASVISHAVADRPEGPYTVVGPVLTPRGPGFWDATTCHNPHIQKVGDRYALFYMGNSNGKTDTKRIGLALADSLDGPWTRPDAPLLLPGPAGAWDDHCTTNPSYIQHPNGQSWLYYKSWNTAEYDAGSPPVRGNRKYGLAIADRLEGPYRKVSANPIIDFSSRGENRQLEDAFFWHEADRFRVVSRDMGIFGHNVGLYMDSADGLKWSEPTIAFRPVASYVDQPPAPKHLSKYGRFERPQMLMRNGRPAYMFTTTQGGAYETSSPFIFRIV
jgi:hypothetical protein